MLSKTALFSILVAVGAKAQSGAWGQCGGIGWTGATTCVAGYTCTYSSAYYSQCLPGTASSTVSTTKSSTQTATSTKTGTSTITGASPTGSAGSGPGTTLQTGYYWIRSVEAPNFHKYLQTDPPYTTGTALMDDYTTAGQFNIISGQLVELLGNGLLYMNVSPQTGNETMLAVSFSKTQNTYGTFAFQGDAVTWSISTISRPNTAAWYVCTGQQLFINLGNYDYLTPANCADETIHYYNGATAVDK